MDLVSWRTRFKAYPNNLPLPLPGLYRITNLINGKSYFGISQNIEKRAHRHARLQSEIRKLENSIKKHGVENFLIEPLFYTLFDVDQNFLKQLEADYIKEYDAIENGYNLKASEGPLGPYGEAFSRNQKEVMNRPEVRAKLRLAAAANKDRIAAGVSTYFQSLSLEEQRAYTDKKTAKMKTPEGRARQAEGRRQVHARPEMRAKYIEAQNKPETRAKRIATLRIVMSTPEALAALSIRSKEIMNRPEVKAKLRAAHLGKASVPKGTRRFITDGFTCKTIMINDPLPDNWRYGQAPRITKPK